jgi:hypothetical protein
MTARDFLDRTYPKLEKLMTSPGNHWAIIHPLPRYWEEVKAELEAKGFRTFKVHGSYAFCITW